MKIDSNIVLLNSSSSVQWWKLGRQREQFPPNNSYDQDVIYILKPNALK